MELLFRQRMQQSEGTHSERALGFREREREREREEDGQLSGVAESHHPATPTPCRGFGWELVNLGETPGMSDLRSVHRVL